MTQKLCPRIPEHQRTQVEPSAGVDKGCVLLVFVASNRSTYCERDSDIKQFDCVGIADGLRGERQWRPQWQHFEASAKALAGAAERRAEGNCVQAGRAWTAQVTCLTQTLSSSLGRDAS